MTFSPRTVGGVTTLQGLALAPPILAVGWSDGVNVYWILAVAALTALAWEAAFFGIRKRDPSAHGITTAFIVALFCPADIALWQLLIATSMGVIFGELIFGGRGFGFVNAAALSLSLLFVAFPDTTLRTLTPLSALAVLPGFIILFAAGLTSIAVVTGVGIGCVGVLMATGQSLNAQDILTPLALGTVFLIADPASASTTAMGRWAYGVFAGGMVVVFSPIGALSQEAIVAAALLASVFAPLIDYCAVGVHMRWIRRSSHG